MSTNIKYVIRRTWVALALIALVTIALWSLISPAYSCGTIAYVAVEGDNHWSIAEMFCSGDIREVVFELVQKYGPTVQPGQLIERD
jgi:hypothetical protein